MHESSHGEIATLMWDVDMAASEMLMWILSSNIVTCGGLKWIGDVAPSCIVFNQLEDATWHQWSNRVEPKWKISVKN